MNKRLVEIHNQTMYCIADNGSLRISDRIPTGYTEKFAELIVRECVMVADEHDCNLSGNGGEILKHFGVE